MPSSLASASSTRTAPERRRGPASRTRTARTDLGSPGASELPAGPHHLLDPERACARGSPRGGRARSPRRGSRGVRLTSSARASPTAIRAVVLAEGARPSGQASSTGPIAMQRSAASPSELPARSVIAISEAPSRRSGGDQAEHLLGLAALRERDHHVVGADAPEVAVDRLGRVHREGARPGRGQGRRQLLADQPRLAHPRDDHAPGAAQDQVGPPRDLPPEPPADPLDRLGLDAQDLPREGQVLGLRLQGQRRVRHHRHRGPPCPTTLRARDGRPPPPGPDRGRHHSPSPPTRQRGTPT